ncbi:uncharacterized protein LOC122663172 [Telopea speciosissima]|uniref:uncharacterized protein LOC122663172 n=1 Tax=Telopea speciosissima TaxID=54955 RepID=UPI001CC59673|nr:uncharacterized protein LOC122663172 [Telopea speciosissima]
MDSENPSQSKTRDIATWTNEISHFFLECLSQQHRHGRNGDNGLKREQWQAISLKIKDRFNTTYEWEQCKNHYRIWKARLKALFDLQNNYGLGWNAIEMRFDAPQHVWAEFKKKEQKYWRNTKVLPIYLEVAVWLGNELANGNASTTPAQAAAAVAGLDTLVLSDDGESQNEETTTHTPVGSSTCRRGRPQSTGTSKPQKKKKKKKKKQGAEKVASPLKAIAAAITNMVQNDSQVALGDKIIDAIDVIPDIDFHKQAVAKSFFLGNKDLGLAIIRAKVEDRLELVDLYMSTAGRTN